MNIHKRHNTEDLLKDIQKISDANHNINNYHNYKKSKYSNSSYTSAFVSSLNNNPHILKVACYNVVSFVNLTNKIKLFKKHCLIRLIS